MKKKVLAVANTFSPFLSKPKINVLNELICSHGFGYNAELQPFNFIVECRKCGF